MVSERNVIITYSFVKNYQIDYNLSNNITNTFQPELRKQETKRVVTTTKRKRKKAKVVGGVVQRRDSSTTSVPVPFGSY